MYTAAVLLERLSLKALKHRLAGLFSVAALLVLAALLLAPVSGLLPGTGAYAQTPASITGTWRGTLLAGQYDPLEIVFHIHDNAGSYSATLDIPAQSRFGMSADSVSIRGSNIMIRMNGIQAEYYAGLVLAEDGIRVVALDGDWGQSGEHIPLRMERDDS